MQSRKTQRLRYVPTMQKTVRRRTRKSGGGARYCGQLTLHPRLSYHNAEVDEARIPRRSATRVSEFPFLRSASGRCPRRRLSNGRPCTCKWRGTPELSGGLGHAAGYSATALSTRFRPPTYSTRVHRVTRREIGRNRWRRANETFLRHAARHGRAGRCSSARPPNARCRNRWEAHRTNPLRMKKGCQTVGRGARVRPARIASRSRNSRGTARRRCRISARGRAADRTRLLRHIVHSDR